MVPLTTTTVIETAISATEDWEGSSVLRLYPNPVKNQLRINSPQAAIESISFFDVAGSLLETTEYSLIKEAVLDTNHLQEGAYLVKIQTEKGQTVRRIIVMKK